MSDIAAIAASNPKAHSLHQALYNSEDAFARDKEKILFRQWLLAGHQSSAANPGDWFLCDIAGESVIIVRGNDGHLRGFANVCRHRGSQICVKPSGTNSVLVCPYHAWSYNLDGTLRAARQMPAGFDKAEFGLKPVAVEVSAGLAFICLAETPPDFTIAREAIAAAFTQYGWPGARVAHQETYGIAANWKLAVENYLECYHCTPSHPEYSRLHALEKPLDQIQGMTDAMEARTSSLGISVPSLDHRVASSSGDASIFIFRYPLYDGVKTGSPDGEPVAPLMGAFTAYDGGVTSAHFAPCSFFIAYPDHGVLYRFIPLSAGRTAMELTWLVNGEAAAGLDYERDRLTWLWRVTTEADKRITEDNQKGVNSRYYQPGPYAPAEPNAIAWIAWYLGEIG